VGPTGAKVSGEGELVWTPGNSDLGEQRFKIRAVVDGKKQFIRFSTLVQPPEKPAARPAAGTARAPRQAGTFYVVTGRPSLRPAADGAGTWFCDGRVLRLLGGDGAAVRRRLDLKEEFHVVADRGEYLVGLGAKKLVLLDAADGSEKRTIELPCARTRGLALDPTRKRSYAIGIDPSRGSPAYKERSFFLLSVDEESGAVTPHWQVHGNQIVVHPSGRYLFASYSEFIVDSTTLFGIYGRPYTFTSSMAIDWLASYAILGSSVRPLHFNEAPGDRGSRLRIMPDGSGVSYVALRGYRGGGKSGAAIPVFDPQDIRKTGVCYDVGGRGKPRDVAGHPNLPLVAAATGKDVLFFERNTGAKLPAKADVAKLALKLVREIRFSASGSHLLIRHYDSLNRHVLRAVPLVLTAEERSRLGAPVTMAPLSIEATMPKAAIPRSHIEAVAGAGSAERKAPREIARDCKDAVVVVSSKEGGGTGFFVGSRGYVLTCAHVLEGAETATVKHLDPEAPTVDGKTGSSTVSAKILSTDEYWTWPC